MSTSRLAVKRLTESDRTFFAPFHHQEGQRSKQKGINLNADVFVDAFFPGLRGRFAAVQFPLVVLGPGGAGGQRLSRKALRTAGSKNWRLNGEFVNAPPEAPGQYEALEAGDLAVFGFEGELEPSEVTLVLISRRLDARLHAELSAHVDSSWRKTFQVISGDALEAVLAATADVYPQGHPLSVLMGTDTEISALQGSVEEQERIASTDGIGHAVSRETVSRQAAAAATIGYAGEDAFEAWLRQSGHADDDYRWISLSHAHAAYDFQVIHPRWADEARFVDVKATSGRHSSTFYMSSAEVRWAAAHEGYRIARISGLTESSAELVILTGIHQLCRRLLESLQLPEGVHAVSFAIDPDVLQPVYQGTVELDRDED